MEPTVRVVRLPPGMSIADYCVVMKIIKEACEIPVGKDGLPLFLKQ